MFVSWGNLCCAEVRGRGLKGRDDIGGLRGT